MIGEVKNKQDEEKQEKVRLDLEEGLRLRR